MARLTKNQLALRVEREKKKQDAIRKKMAIQEKKELYGENWKVVEQQKLQKEMEEEIGSDKSPKIYDSKDLYDFFSPLAFYRDKEENAINMDFKKFMESEELYSAALKEIDAELGTIQQNKKDDENFKRDGDSKSDSDYPIDAVKEEKLDLKKELNDKEKRELDKIKKSSPQSKAKGRVHQIVATYFNRFVPLYDKHICTCCGMPKDINDYYIVYNYTCSDRVDNKGNYHMWVCKECSNKLFGYCYSILANKKVELAMQYVCAYLNLYWDSDLFYLAKEKFEESGRRGTLLGSYIATINSNSPGMSFMDSKFLKEDYETTVRQVDPNEAPFDWEKEDAKNKSTVIKMVGYDPFSYETDENKKILYRDLLNILDEGMQNDLVKFQAGIQIVLSFFKLRQMNEKEYQLNKDDAPISELKALSDLKAKELKAISDFSRDNGFSERYATAKAKGENTLTGIMNKMNEAKYEKAVLNRYDIETSATIQQAADASFKAIFSQLGLGESEVWKVTQEQFEELTKLRKENSRLQEELRKAKYREAEVNLLEKKRQRDRELGIEDDDDD